MKKITHEIIVSQKNKSGDGINPISTIVGAKSLFDDSSTLSSKLGALVLIEKILKDLKDHFDNLMDELKATPSEEICKRLVEEGVLGEGETPIISVVDKTGTKTSKIVCETTRKSLNIDALKALASDPAVFATMPDELKKSSLQTTAVIKSLLDAGTLPDMYKPYVCEEEIKTTGLKGTKI